MSTPERVSWIVASLALAFVVALVGDWLSSWHWLDAVSGFAVYRAGIMALTIWVACVAMSFNFRSSWEDERDAAIRHRAGGIAYSFALVLITVIILGLGYGRHDWVDGLAAVPLARTLLLLLAATALVQATTQIVLYRRQSP